jgi:hypothetical protein
MDRRLGGPLRQTKCGKKDLSLQELNIGQHKKTHSTSDYEKHTQTADFNDEYYVSRVQNIQNSSFNNLLKISLKQSMQQKVMHYKS